MPDILIRITGRAGHIMLNRPHALNAVTDDMVRALDAALIGWADDPTVDLVLIDAGGERAFCAGGDLSHLYAAGMAGNHAYGQAFWRDEYRMNARIAAYPKPIVTSIQGLCLGGGVGIACHASHRIVCDSTRIALPEVAIGLIPDIGSSYLLSRAPGHLGAWMGATASRIGAGDAIYAGFADAYVPQTEWPAMTEALTTTGLSALPNFFRPAPTGTLAALKPHIDRHFHLPSLSQILSSLATDPSDWAQDTRAAISRVSPLAAAVAVDIQRRLGKASTLLQALEMEYRFTHRAQAQTDFLEGIRAAIIDKDRTPRWRETTVADVTQAQIDALLAPLGPDTLTF